ncbi:hypothetical protein AGOR_G00023450 [Albula goreensis]|uniref:DUF4592 domain-containing protein n=1 Tax=Albula goreensis TaxID=1534307 RepID=A0A8T3E1D4_9TELE|nr:hypothetical protein AGOR_G00023450 [Albula goreensis]
MASGLPDVTAKQEPADTTVTCSGKKKSKFQTFKKFFAKKKQKQPLSPVEANVLKSSQSTDDVNSPEPTPVQSNTSQHPGSKVNMGNKAMSHDSVFVSDSPSSVTCDGVTSSQESIHGKVKSLQMQLKQAIRVGSPSALIGLKRGEDAGAQSEDDGLPHSPPEITTLHTVLAGSHGSSNPVWRSSSLSLEESDTEDDQVSCEASSRPASPHVSLPLDFSQPASPASCLDSSAARHRIAIKHKACAKRKPARRGIPENSKLKALSGAPRLNEEKLSAGSTEPSAWKLEQKDVTVEQADTGRVRAEVQADRTEAQPVLTIQQLSHTGEEPAITLRLSTGDQEERSVAQDLSDKRCLNVDTSSSTSESSSETKEILPVSEAAQEPLQTLIPVEGGEPDSLLPDVLSSLGCPCTPRPATEAEDQVSAPQPQFSDKRPTAMDILHVTAKHSKEEHSEEERHEQTGECDEEEFGPAEGNSEDHGLPEEEEEQQHEEEAIEVCEQDSFMELSRFEEEEVEASLDSEQESLSNCKTASSAACGGPADTECVIELAGSAEVVEDGNCPLKSQNKILPTSDTVQACPVSISFSTENQTTLSPAPENLWKQQATPGTKARFTIAPAWQRSLSGGASKDSCVPILSDSEVFRESADRPRDPPHKAVNQTEEPPHPCVPETPSCPGRAQVTTFIPPPQDLSPQESRSAENLFGIRLRRTSALLRISSTSSLEIPGETTEPQISSHSEPPRSNPAPPKTPLPLDDPAIKVKKTPEVRFGMPAREVASPSWISVARQKQKVFKENSLEETTGRESPLEKVESQRKISLPISLNQTNKDQPKASSSPLTVVSCSREISRNPNTEKERNGSLSASPPSPLSQDEPPWLALAKKKAKAWSEMPQTVQ